MSEVDAKTKLRGLSAEAKERLRRKLSDHDVVSRIARQPREADGGQFLLSAAQERLWIHHQLDPESPAFNVGFVVHFEGALDPSRLHRSTSRRVSFTAGTEWLQLLPMYAWQTMVLLNAGSLISLTQKNWIPSHLKCLFN